MLELQLDRFSDICVRPEHRLPRSLPSPLAPAEMDDEALIAAIPQSQFADSSRLAAEAGRRRLAGGVPALAELCLRFAGFGVDRLVPEQAAAIEGLAVIGGRDA